jgi:hypothetical protein
MTKVRFAALLIVGLSLALITSRGQAQSPTDTPTDTPIPTDTPTPGPTDTPTVTPTPTYNLWQFATLPAGTQVVAWEYKVDAGESVLVAQNAAQLVFSVVGLFLLFQILRAVKRR